MRCIGYFIHYVFTLQCCCYCLAGCNDGSCTIWDFDTRGVAKELREKEVASPITSVSWSKCGHRLLSAATDKTLSLWDVGKGLKIGSVILQQSALHARLYPGTKRPSVCLACPMSGAPILVNFETGMFQQLHCCSCSRLAVPQAKTYVSTTRKFGSLI